MPEEVIAVFDIGKTNKKFLLFNSRLGLIQEQVVKFSEVPDDDDYLCDDINQLESWMQGCLSATAASHGYSIRAINFATYGATLMYVGENGKRLTPVYNYLKPMPEWVLDGFYDKYGGVEEFSRRTASPALGMLNSGLQVLWLKQTRPGIFSQVRMVLHFPQYLSYVITGQLTSEFTSIGCHTGLWDFDNHCYHKWVRDEEIPLPVPVSNSTLFRKKLFGQFVNVGIGIHDSSASLVPYIQLSLKKFILISTGTWCIFMNPFNSEPLTAEQLRRDSLCYMSVMQQQVKSSRLFLGHIHDVNVEFLSNYYSVDRGYFKKVKVSNNEIYSLLGSLDGRVFFRDGVPAKYVDHKADLCQFSNFDEAYRKLISDLVEVCMESLELIIPEDDQTEEVYISGGFARNDIFVRLLAAHLPGKVVYTSEIDNATSLGAAMVIRESVFTDHPPVSLGLKKIATYS